jgi:adenylate cyclase
VLPNYGGNQRRLPKSNAAARKALELDPTLAHPHAVLGSNEMQYDWDFAGERLSSRSLGTRSQRCHCAPMVRDDIGMIGGREQEALAEINRAHELDPQSVVITSSGRRYSRYGTAVRRRHRRFARSWQMRTRHSPIAHDCLAYAYWGKRMYPQVIEEWKAYGRLSNEPRI